MRRDDETPIGDRRTRQRETIERVLHDAPGPMSPAEIHEAAAVDLPSLGLATVYRTIKLLAEAGRIHGVASPDGSTRYEPAHLHHHHHFYCRTCQRVYDLPGCPLQGNVVGDDYLPAGFHAEGHELTITGVCESCGGIGGVGGV